jgi:hypothetical protein
MLRLRSIWRAADIDSSGNWSDARKIRGFATTRRKLHVDAAYRF